jgi:transcriptional regulator with XRE-family HTH domain
LSENGSTSLGTRIKEARLRKKLTLKGLGELLGGVDHSTLSKIERGLSNPNRRTLISLAQALQENFGESWLNEHITAFEKDDKERKIEELSVEKFIGLKFGIGEPAKLSKRRKNELIALARILDRELETFPDESDE